LTIEGYLARSGASLSSLNTYRKILTKCEANLGKPLSAASGRDIERLKTHLRTMRSGKNYAAELRRFYKAAMKTAEAAKDTEAKERFQAHAEVCVLKQKVRRLDVGDILTLPEINAILGAADSLRDRALLAVMWATGQRVSAVAALQLGDLKDVPSDNGGAAIRASFRVVKVRGQEHVSYILDSDGGDHLRAWLRAYPFDRTETAPVFPSNNTVGKGGPLTESAILKMIQRAARRAGLTKKVTCHLVRHSRATHLLRLGLSSQDVKRQCGWDQGSNVMERRYAHLIDTDTYNALLRANGLEPPENADLGKLAAAEGDLKAVVPLAAAPGAKVNPLEAEMAQLRADVALLSAGFREAVAKLAAERGIASKDLDVTAIVDEPDGSVRVDIGKKGAETPGKGISQPASRPSRRGTKGKKALRKA